MKNALVKIYMECKKIFSSIDSNVVGGYIISTHSMQKFIKEDLYNEKRVDEADIFSC